MSELVLSGLIVGLIAMIFFTPFLLAKGVSRLEGELTAKEYILCAIPIINTIRAERKYLGKIGIHCISTIILILGITFRVVQWRFMYSNITMGLIGMAIFWFSLLLFAIGNIVLVYTIINDANTVRGFKLILLSVAYPFGQYYIGSYLVNVIRHMKEQESTFKR